MRFRWTIEDLEATSEKDLILQLITERVSNLNRYAPVGRRLVELRAWVKVNIPDQKEATK